MLVGISSTIIATDRQRNNRIIEYSELEVTNKDHQVQLLPPQRTTENLNLISEDMGRGVTVI